MSHAIAYQIEAHLSQSGDWLAGGQGPTSADFMMSFALEAWSGRSPHLLGPKTKDYIKRIHERYVALVMLHPPALIDTLQ